MSLKMWVYHEQKEPATINAETYVDYHKNGWEDSPAKCKGFTEIPSIKESIDNSVLGGIAGLGINSEKARNIAISQLGEKTQEICNDLNNSINTKSDIRKEKQTIARKIKAEFGERVSINEFKNFKGINELLDYYNELKHGDS